MAAQNQTNRPDVYENNLNALKRRYPELYRKVMAAASGRPAAVVMTGADNTCPQPFIQRPRSPYPVLRH